MAGLASLISKAGIGGIGEKKTNAVLAEFDTNDVLVLKHDGAATPPVVGPLYFQYFPESIQDSKQVNYQRKDIPGASLPIYQWMNSGERSLSFSAVFTSDTDLLDTNGQLRTDLVTSQKNSAVDTRNADCRAAVAWLRRLMLPAYQAKGTALGVPAAIAPPCLLLYMKGSGIGLAGGAWGAFSNDDYVYCRMSQCDVSYESFFPSGFPRTLVVQLGFFQVAQHDGIVSFPQRGGTMVDAITGDLANYAGYKFAGDLK